MILKSKKYLLTEQFLGQLDRAEFSTHPIEYSKGIRSTLIALGYDEDFINGEFRERLEDYYSFHWHK